MCSCWFRVQLRTAYRSTCYRCHPSVTDQCQANSVGPNTGGGICQMTDSYMTGKKITVGQVNCQKSAMLDLETSALAVMMTQVVL